MGNGSQLAAFNDQVSYARRWADSELKIKEENTLKKLQPMVPEAIAQIRKQLEGKDTGSISVSSDGAFADKNALYRNAEKRIEYLAGYMEGQFWNWVCKEYTPALKRCLEANCVPVRKELSSLCRKLEKETGDQYTPGELVPEEFFVFTEDNVCMPQDKYLSIIKKAAEAAMEMIAPKLRLINMKTMGRESVRIGSAIVTGLVRRSHGMRLAEKMDDVRKDSRYDVSVLIHRKTTEAFLPAYDEYAEFFASNLDILTKGAFNQVHSAVLKEFDKLCCNGI